MTLLTAQASKLLGDLKAIRLQVEAELQKQQQGQPSILRGSQGSRVLDQVLMMERQIELSALPPAEQRVRGMGTIVVDSWPVESELGSLIVAAEQAYLKLKG